MSENSIFILTAVYACVCQMTLKVWQMVGGCCFSTWVKHQRAAKVISSISAATDIKLTGLCFNTSLQVWRITHTCLRYVFMQHSSVLGR